MDTLAISGIILISCLLCSCIDTPSTDAQIIRIDPQKLSTNSISDFYQIKDVIPLETNDFSLIKEIDNIIFTDDRIIIGGVTSPAFMIYDRIGNFVQKMDRRGNGPNEYGREVGTFVIDQNDPDNNLVMNKSPRLLFYNYHSWNQVNEARWIGSTAMLGSLPTGDFLAYQEFGSDDDYFIKLVNPEGKTLKGFLPKPSRVSFTTPIRYMTPFVYHHNNRVYVLPFITHTLYEYNCTDTLLQERYIFDLKNNPPVNLKQLSQRDIDSRSYFNDFYKLYLKHISYNHMILATSRTQVKPSLHIVINLQTLNSEVFKSDDLVDKQEEVPISFFLWTNLDCLVAVVLPEKLVNFTTTRPDSWGSKLKRMIQEDSNPVLVIYKER